MAGYLYVLSNPAMPGLLKIGQTSNLPEQRLRQLNTTGVPRPFVLEACFLVPNPVLLERAAHGALLGHRQASSREFFQLTVSQTLELIMPLVVAAINQSAENPSPAVKDHGLTADELYILQLVVAAGNECGQSRWRLKEWTKLDDLDLEVCIANLVGRKFVARSRESSSYASIWLPTLKGTKFLADHRLIEDWMRK